MPGQKVIWDDERAYYAYMYNITISAASFYRGKFKDRNGNG